MEKLETYATYLFVCSSLARANVFVAGGGGRRSRQAEVSNQTTYHLSRETKPGLTHLNL